MCILETFQMLQEHDKHPTEQDQHPTLYPISNTGSGRGYLARTCEFGHLRFSFPGIHSYWIHDTYVYGIEYTSLDILLGVNLWNCVSESV